MRTVTTAADKTDLVTMAEVKTRLRIEGPAEDGRLSALIAEASAACCDHLGFQIARQRYTHTVKSYGDIELLIGLGHIDTSQTVTVTLGGEAVTDFAVEDAEAGILLREAGWPWSGSVTGITGYRVAGSELPTVTVVATHGWGVPEQTAPAGSAALPPTIARACWETVKEWWLIDQRDPLILGRNVPTGGGSAYVNYSVTGERRELPPVALALLRKYRSLA